MPRSKSALTGRRPTAISARLTEKQHNAFLQLGGAVWLRAQIDEAVAKGEHTAGRTAAIYQLKKRQQNG